MDDKFIPEVAESPAEMCCASCGIAEVDDIKLKKCDACDLVGYCGDTCQQDHLSQHDRACKERAVELRDEILFRQPESSHLGDCLICFLPLPINNKHVMLGCCSKIICQGCAVITRLRQNKENLQEKCPFCRKPSPHNKEEAIRRLTKRVAASDPVALYYMGKRHCLEGDYGTALKYLIDAAELGNAEAHYHLSILYQMGKGAEKDETKKIYHLEEAVIGGHAKARYELSSYEWTNGRFDRAVKHLIISAHLGFDDSIKQLRTSYVDGLVSKEEFATALRAHQAAVDATKSPQREAAAKAKAAGEIRWM
eukprot:scaffold15548_cov84-Skeletonema_dohrnii-CCMP3373.AAC.5